MSAAIKVKEEQNLFEPVFEDIEAVQINSKCSEIDDLAETKKKLQVENIKLRSEQQKAFIELQQYRQDLNALKIKSDNQQKQLLEQRKQLSEKQNVNNSLASKVATLDFALKSSENTIALLNQQLEDEKKKLVDLNRQNKTLNARIKQINQAQDQAASQRKNSVDCDLDREDNEPSVYEVEKIIAHKMKGQKRYFRIRWRGYEENDDTWEPEENLTCPSILKEYLKK